MVTISLGAALICFAGHCYPALVGANTPAGEYQLVRREVNHSGYGGDLLQFKEDEKEVFAIHRVITFNPAQRRIERLRGGSPAWRTITDGCVNVEPEVYEALVNCCANETLTITKD